jgi:hypothetical protein
VVGLIIRVLVLCSVVFAVVYAVTRALRTRLQNKEISRAADEIGRMADEIKKLRQLVEHGMVGPDEYAATSARIRENCERLGLDVPDLPSELPPKKPKD